MIAMIGAAVAVSACSTGSQLAADTASVSNAGCRLGAHYERHATKKRVVVFIHGIFGTAADTWTCSTGSTCWPQLMASDPDWSTADIYVAEYRTPYRGGRMTIDEVVSNLKNRLELDHVFEEHSDVAFIAHSLGGLVVERLLLTYRDLLPRVSSIYFLATPQEGAQIATLGRVFSSDPLLKEMLPGDANDYLANLEAEWRAAGASPGAEMPATYCAYETQPFKGVLVVGRLSSTRNCSGGNPLALPLNHVTIAKPCSTNDDVYGAVKKAIFEQPVKRRMRDVTEQRKHTWSGSVDCNRTNSGVIAASVPLHEGERVTAVSAAYGRTNRIQGATGPTVQSTSGNTAQVAYGFNGLDKDAIGNCPGGGDAEVITTFTIAARVPVDE